MIVALILLVSSAAIWIWSIWGHLSNVMSAVFTILSGVCAFLALPFLYASHGSASPSTSVTSTAGNPPQPAPGIFLFNEPLPNPGEFLGRAYERTTLINRTRKGNATSIVGPRRIGKTWLMTYLKLVAPTQLGTSFRVGYLDASLPKCRTIAGFTTKALEVLGVTTVIADSITVGLDTLQEAVENLVKQNQTPILCIDEFEGLIEAQVFDLNFFTGLRAIAQAGLGLVTASKSPLIDMVSDHVKTSPFFNIFMQITLKPFSVQEAEDFAKVKSAQAGFTDKERGYLLEYVRESEQQRLPIRLQLRGKMLYEDKLAAQTDPQIYLPDTHKYWLDFEKRLEETYRAVVR